MYFARNKLKFYSAFRLCLAVLLLICFIAYNRNLIYDLNKHFDSLDIHSDFPTCHYSTAGDLLPSAADVNFKPALDSIFFIDISCRGGLLSRQACAVEAAARAHPEKEVHLLFAGPVTSFNGTLKPLQTLENVKMSRIHLLNYTQGTPAEILIASGAFIRTRYNETNTLEILKFVTLYKWSGIYLDLDALVVKSLNSLGRNWLAREDDYMLNSAAMSLSADKAGRTLADLALRNIIKNNRGYCWGHDGPIRITQTMKKYCYTDIVALMSADTCDGFEIISPSLLFPIRWKERHRYFLPGTLEWPWVYIFFVWQYKRYVPLKCRYANLAHEYCPSVYEYNGKSFGYPWLVRPKH